MKKNKTILCQECTQYFSVQTAGKESVCFCPFCGEELPNEDDCNEEYDEEYDDEGEDNEEESEDY